jgi:hypothetical protein
MPEEYISADTKALISNKLGPYGECVMREYNKYKDSTNAQLPVLNPARPPADIDEEVEKAVGPGLENGAQVLYGLAMLPQGDGERIGELSKLLERCEEAAGEASDDWVGPQGSKHAC